MACNCKKNVNPKYLEDKDKIILTKSAFTNIKNFVARFLFGIIVSFVIIIGIVALGIYLITSICLGKEMSIRIPNYKKWFKKEK